MDTPSIPAKPAACADCGAPINAGQTRCWLCGNSDPQPASPREKGNDWSSESVAANPYASPAAPDYSATQFSLTTLFLWTTLVAVIAGSASIAPGLAIGLAILCFPAALRTIGNVNRLKQTTGRSPTSGQKMMTFFASFSVVVAAFIAASAAFVATCFPVGLGVAATGASESNFFGVMLFVITVSGAIAAFVGYIVLRRLWWDKK